MYVYIYVYICIYMYLSKLSIIINHNQSINQSINLTIYLSIYLSIYISIYIYIHTPLEFLSCWIICEVYYRSIAQLLRGFDACFPFWTPALISLLRGQIVGLSRNSLKGKSTGTFYEGVKNHVFNYKKSLIILNLYIRRDPGKGIAPLFGGYSLECCKTAWVYWRIVKRCVANPHSRSGSERNMKLDVIFPVLLAKKTLFRWSNSMLVFPACWNGEILGQARALAKALCLGIALCCKVVLAFDS